MIRFAKICPESKPGSSIHVLYSPKVRKDGQVELVPSGKEDLQELYNSYADSCDINVIINKFLNGDVNALSARQVSYGDFSGMPSTYTEWLQLKLDAEQKFRELPAEIRQKFGMSLDRFLATAGSEEWCKNLGIEVENKESEVKSNAAEES